MAKTVNTKTESTVNTVSTKSTVSTKKESTVSTKFDAKAVAEKIEAAFKTDKAVDVIADTKLDKPTGFSYNEYSFIHFYKKGTQRDMFQLYTSSKGARFIIRTTAAEFLDKTVEATPAEKMVKGEKRIIHVIVKCSIEDISDVAKKIISAYQSVPAKPAKEKPVKAEKTTTAKKSKAKKADKEQVVNK